MLRLLRFVGFGGVAEKILGGHLQREPGDAQLGVLIAVNHLQHLPGLLVA